MCVSVSKQGNEKFQSHAGACAFACAGGSAGAGSEMLVPAVLVLALVLLLVLVPLPVRVVLLVLVPEAMPCCCCLTLISSTPRPLLAAAHIRTIMFFALARHRNHRPAWVCTLAADLPTSNSDP